MNALIHRLETPRDEYYASLKTSCRAWDRNLEYCGKPPAVIATGVKPDPNGYVVICGFCQQHADELRNDPNYSDQWTYEDVK